MTIPTKLLTTLAVALLAVSLGCEKSDGPSVGVASEPVPQVQTEEHPSHAPDEELELIAPGFLNGSWRLVRVDDDETIAFVDLTHDADAPTATGDYTMEDGLFAYLADRTGELTSANWASGSTTLTFNPTIDADELYTVVVSGADENRLVGTLSGAPREGDALEVEVALERVVEGEDDGLAQEPPAMDSWPEE